MRETSQSAQRRWRARTSFAVSRPHASYRMVAELARTGNLTEQEVGSKLLKPSDVWLSAEQLIQLGIADIIF